MLYIFNMGIGDWGLGIGDWGLGALPQTPTPQPPTPQTPKPQSPIPNPQLNFYYFLKNLLILINYI